MAPLARAHVHVSTSDHSDSGSDSDAPEAVNTVQAKKGAKGRDDELKRFEAGERERRRELNRKRDEVLKARAAGAVGAKNPRRAEGRGSNGLDGEEDEGEGPSAAALEARMQRAMAAAEEEDDDSDNDMDDMGDEDARMDDDLMDDEDDEEEEENLEEELDLGGPSASHLPDHLFAALDRLPPPSASASASRMAKGKVASAPQSSRKRRRSRPKDIVLGYVFDHVLAHLLLSYRNPIPFRSSFKRLSSLLLLSIALYTMHSPFLLCTTLSRIPDHGRRIYLHHSPFTIHNPTSNIRHSLPPPPYFLHSSVHCPLSTIHTVAIHQTLDTDMHFSVPAPSDLSPPPGPSGHPSLPPGPFRRPKSTGSHPRISDLACVPSLRRKQSGERGRCWGRVRWARLARLGASRCLRVGAW
jgi:hypothetical protein